jgi:uncharacterized coiled-coil protein SlyX
MNRENGSGVSPPRLISGVDVPLAPGGSGPHDSRMEARVTKLESDVAHIKDDVSEIKGILGRLAPVIDRMDGFQQAALPTLATKLELADLKLQIEKRPTRRQTMADVALIVTTIGALIAIGTHLAH